MVILLSAISTLPAATITVTDFVADQAPLPSLSVVGTIATSGGGSSLPGNPGVSTYTFDLTNVDLDGGGSGNDSMRWTILVSATSNRDGATAASVTAGSLWGIDSIDDSDRSDRVEMGEVLTLTAGTVTYGLNGETATANIGSFVGFTEAYVNNLGGTLVLNDVAYTANTTVRFSNTLAETLIFTGGDSAAQGRLDKVAFQVSTDPVPEPATISLLALGGMAILKRRKK
ncbi:MAG: PEP-CTERM sorting domain-containing protein [Phycisphaerales bacterium]|jgi:hypothetical protein|nr:PEP-CTERM sorting domain-containing protein [Phycisphaerales bacterium]MBT7170362.1 PEP-CTERM sorting domain-containing protein [Phycisphaerales bacterium]